MALVQLPLPRQRGGTVDKVVAKSLQVTPPGWTNKRSVLSMLSTNRKAVLPPPDLSEAQYSLSPGVRARVRVARRVLQRAVVRLPLVRLVRLVKAVRVSEENI